MGFQIPPLNSSEFFYLCVRKDTAHVLLIYSLNPKLSTGKR